MNGFFKSIVLFSVLKSTCTQAIPDLVRVRTIEEAKDAEFYALDTIGLIEKWGYPVEEHKIITSDGYILDIYEIPWSPKAPNCTAEKPVFLLLPGLMASSDLWLLFGPDRSLPLQLADAGYNVWLGNYRGSTYGHAHVKLSPETRKFWDFSQHEVAIYDVSRIIDYVLNITDQTSLTYLGHSQGTTVAFILLSELPEYNDKINLVVCFTPVGAWFVKDPLRRFLFTNIKIAQSIIDFNGTIELFPQSSVLAGFFKRICVRNEIVDLCMAPVEFSIGKSRDHLTNNEVIKILCHYPSGASAKMFWHYVQYELSNKFRQYDYENEEENIRRYGQSEPPEYNLKNIRSPMIMFYGRNDPLSKVEDVRELEKRISSKTISEAVRSKKFTHGDFILARDVKTMVNDRVIEQVSQFLNGKIPSLQFKRKEG